MQGTGGLTLACIGTFPFADEILRGECGHNVQASIQENLYLGKPALLSLSSRMIDAHDIPPVRLY